MELLTELLSTEEGPVFACILKGNWVGYCPRPGCNSAEFLPPPGQKPEIFYKQYPNNRCTPTCFLCSYCGMQAPVIWPADPLKLMEPLSVRPIPRTRNWFPEGHPVREQGITTGQSAMDLWLENADHGLGS